MIFGLLPVKVTNPKQRLAELLSRSQREQLARLMYEHALHVLTSARCLDRVLVASSDAEILNRARAAGAICLPEETQNGHSHSADRAARKAIEWGATAVLMVPIDVPLLSVADLESVLQQGMGADPGLLIVPSSDGTGTNALLRTPPDVIESRFGPGSFEKHVQQAQSKGLAVKVARPEGLVFDLDTPEDLSHFLARGTNGAVADYLRRTVNGKARG